MEKIRRRIKTFHIVVLSILLLAFGAVLTSSIVIFRISDSMAADAKNLNTNLECSFCEETVRAVIEEERAAEEAERLKKIAEARGVIYLTFDDGPGEYTNTLLDTLKKYDVKATFFVTGNGDDAVIKREFDEGHTVALHTMSHQYAHIYANLDNYFGDLTAVSDRVKNITGEESKILRFPGGSSNLVSKRYDHGARIMSTLSQEVEARGYHYFDWNVDSDDAGRARSADVVYNNVISRLKDGANVVLQHDVKPYSVEAVGAIIEYGLSHNFIFDKITMDTPVVHHSVNN